MCVCAVLSRNSILHAKFQPRLEAEKWYRVNGIIAENGVLQDRHSGYVTLSSNNVLTSLLLQACNTSVLPK
jgi:hypothetical protein